MSLKENFPNNLSSFQTEVLLGSLLGDGSLFRPKPSYNTNLSFTRGAKDLDYLKWDLEVFSNICTSDRKICHMVRERQQICGIPCKKVYEEDSFSTRNCHLLNPFFEKWYPNGVKIVPLDLVLTPLIVAIWFCDDGYIRVRGKNNNTLHLRFCSEGFTREENEFLADELRRLCGEKFIVSRLNKSSNKYRISGYDLTARSLARLIDKFVPNCMNKKKTWITDTINIYDNNYEGRNQTLVNRINFSIKEKLTIDFLKTYGAFQAKELSFKLNELFNNNNLTKLSDQYMLKFIEKLYKRGLIKREKHLPINSKGAPKYFYFIK